MAVISNTRVEPHGQPPTPELAAAPRPATTRVFIPLVTPYLYGMERAVIELFDALRPEVEPFFLQSNQIFQLQLPIVEEMKRRGFSIQLLPDRKHWERLAKPRSLRHLFQMIVASVRSNLAILKGVRGKDVLYVPGISAASGCLLAAIYCRLTGRRVIHHFHDLGTTNRLFPLWLPFVTDFVHNSEFGFQTIAEKLPRIRSKRNFVVPLIVEVDERPLRDPEVCQELAAQRNLFFVGQIAGHKGVDLLVQAFKVVAEKHSDVMLHLIGEGKEEFRAELQGEISGAGLKNRVKFWGFREDATRFLPFAYVYVQSSPPSRFLESFGRSVVEAMALGVPTVSFRNGALQQIVLSEQSGVLCDENSVSLADTISRFLLDDNLRNRCGACAKRRYEQLYSAALIRRRWSELFVPPVAESTVQHRV
jgi:glycosyltransferase involved in cell wall biosynthesis